MSDENLPVGARAARWMVGGDTGISSKTIWSVMMNGAEPDWSSVPMDGADFGRCYRLLKLIPEWRPRLGEVADVAPRWRKLVEAWDELELLYVRALAGKGEGELYRRISECIDERRAR